MFGGAKPGFGQASTSSGFGFGSAATTSPFGQSTFGKTTTGGFGTTPGFGTQQNTSLFGGAQNPNTGIFGTTTSTAFGSTTTAPTSFGAFSQPQQSASLFGSQPATGQSSLFGQATTSAFGAAKPSAFGFGQAATQPSTSLFGQTASLGTTTGFGSFGQANQTTNAFSTAPTAFGQTGANANSTLGTATVKYQPTMGADTLLKGGTANSVTTKQHCITAMKEYDNKSMEELRMEDYLANRKGPQTGTSTGFGAFGATQNTGTSGGIFGAGTQQTTGLFGQQPNQTTENKNPFGTNLFGQTNTGFGSTATTNSFLAKPFSTPATSTTGFSFGSTTTDASNPFGTKPAFGQPATTNLFGQTAAQNTTGSAFGQPNNTGFGTFGTGTQQPSLFGNTATDNKSVFGLPSSTANTGFGTFGANTNTSTGGIFGQKSTPGFGATSTFGTTATNTGFGGFQNNTGGTLFNSTLNKPTTSGFSGFGTQPTSSLSFNSGQPSLFGNTSFNKPLFGSGTQTGQTGGGLFGGGLFGNNNTLGSFGSNTLGGNATLGGGVAQQTTAPVHQQILSRVTSPYGDNPIFKDMKRPDDTDAIRATNPDAQKAALEVITSQFKVSAKPNYNSIRVKPLRNSHTKKALFDGLEEFDSSVEGFSLKPNARRLIIKPKVSEPAAQNTSVNLDVSSQGSNSPSVSGEHNNSDTPTNTTVNTIRHNSSSLEILHRNVPPANNISAPTNGSSPNIGNSNRKESMYISWLNANRENRKITANAMAPMNNTLSELVPRKSAELISTEKDVATGKQTNKEMLNKSAILNESSSEIGISNRSLNETVSEPIKIPMEPHPTGIVLEKQGNSTKSNSDDNNSIMRILKEMMINFTHINECQDLLLKKVERLDQAMYTLKEHLILNSTSHKENHLDTSNLESNEYTDGVMEDTLRYLQNKASEEGLCPRNPNPILNTNSEIVYKKITTKFNYLPDEPKQESNVEKQNSDVENPVLNVKNNDEDLDIETRLSNKIMVKSLEENLTVVGTKEPHLIEYIKAVKSTSDDCQDLIRSVSKMPGHNIQIKKGRFFTPTPAHQTINKTLTKASEPNITSAVLTKTLSEESQHNLLQSSDNTLMPLFPVDLSKTSSTIPEQIGGKHNTVITHGSACSDIKNSLPKEPEQNIKATVHSTSQDRDLKDPSSKVPEDSTKVENNTDLTHANGFPTLIKTPPKGPEDNIKGATPVEHIRGKDLTNTSSREPEKNINIIDNAVMSQGSACQDLNESLSKVSVHKLQTGDKTVAPKFSIWQDLKNDFIKETQQNTKATAPRETSVDNDLKNTLPNVPEDNGKIKDTSILLKDKDFKITAAKVSEQIYHKPDKCVEPTLKKTTIPYKKTEAVLVGVPFIEGEHLMNVYRNLCLCVGVDPAPPIDSVRRVVPYNDSDIIIEFAWEEDKNTIVGLLDAFCIDICGPLNTRYLGFKEEKRIYCYGEIQEQDEIIPKSTENISKCEDYIPMLIQVPSLPAGQYNPYIQFYPKKGSYWHKYKENQAIMMGVPFVSDENLNNTYLSMCHWINLPTPPPLYNIYRQLRNCGSDIIVEFRTERDKNDVIKAAREYYRTTNTTYLTLKCIGFDSDDLMFFFSGNLSNTDVHIFRQAHYYLEEGRIGSAFVKYDQVMVQKDENEEAIPIDSVSKLVNVVNGRVKKVFFTRQSDENTVEVNVEVPKVLLKNYLFFSDVGFRKIYRPK